MEHVGGRMIHRFVFHNDRLLPVTEVRLSPGQAGLLNGWGLFTTVRIYEGFPFEENVVRGQLAELLRANQVREGAARVYVIYNQVGFWRSDENFPRVDLLLCSADLPAYREPARLGLREHGRHAASPLAGVKVISWLDNVWNYYEAQQAGFDEVVLLNERGEVAECTAANIFCVKDGRVATPPVSAGCLQGITRSVLLEIGAGAGAPVEERVLRPEDLYAADEIFISSTNRNLLGVGEVNGRKIAAAPGAVTVKLEKAFGEYVRQCLEARSAGLGKR